MAFRVKDLMISILPGEGEGQGGFLSRFPCHCGCTYGYTEGCGPTIGGGGTQTLMMMMCPQMTMGCGESSFTGHCRFVSNIFRTQCEPEFSWTGRPTTLLTIGFSPFCCLGWSTVAGPVAVPPGGDPAAMAEQLAAMKAQLQEAIAQIENQEKIVNELAQPQSEAEINELQAKLKDAHDELERRKSELKKKH